MVHKNAINIMEVTVVHMSVTRWSTSFRKVGVVYIILELKHLKDELYNKQL